MADKARANKTVQEVTPLSVEDSFIIMERKKSSFNFPIHVHNEYELNFVENIGIARRVVGDSITLVEDNDLVLITDAKLEHAWFNEPSTSQSIREITIQFHPNLFGEEFLEKNQMHKIRTLFDTAKKGISFSNTTKKKAIPLLNKLITIKEHNFKSILLFLVLLDILSQDLSFTVLSSSSFSTHFDYFNSRRVKKVYDYLEANYPKDIKICDLAEHLKMTEVTFSRFFKRHTNKTFIVALNEFRIGIASRQLVSSTIPISEIAFNTGFSNLSHFNKMFKGIKGFTPKEFRNINTLGKNFRKI